MKNKSRGLKKWKSLLVSLTMFASILAILAVIPTPVSASSPNTHYGYLGYMGNDSIYMTTGTSKIMLRYQTTSSPNIRGIC